MKTKQNYNRFCSGLKIHIRPISSGFTLVEVLIAGSILLMVMVGISRISVQSITSGRNRMERDRIEAAIHNNIQLIQQADAARQCHGRRTTAATALPVFADAVCNPVR